MADQGTRAHAPETRWGARAEQALYDHVASGKGAVVYHASLQLGSGWHDDFEKMAGGVMREHSSRRAPINDFRVSVAAPDHPVTAGMPASFPHYDDDLYVNLVWPDDADVEVLLTGWDNPLRYTQVPDQWDARVEWAATGAVSIPLPEGFGQPVPGGDWSPTELEPRVRSMYEGRKAAAS